MGKIKGMYNMGLRKVDSEHSSLAKAEFQFVVFLCGIDEVFIY